MAAAETEEVGHGALQTGPWWAVQSDACRVDACCWCKRARIFIRCRVGDGFVAVRTSVCVRVPARPPSPPCRCSLCVLCEKSACHAIRCALRTTLRRTLSFLNMRLPPPPPSPYCATKAQVAKRIESELKWIAGGRASVSKARAKNYEKALAERKEGGAKLQQLAEG